MVWVEDNNRIPEITANLKALEGLEARGGIFADGLGATQGESSEGDAATIAEYANYNEFGTSKIPSRPFMRQTFDENEAKFEQRAEIAIKNVIDGADPHQQAGQVAESIVRATHKTIKAGDFAPNSAKTLSQKSRANHGAKPLLDTGSLFHAIEGRVEGGAND